MESCVNTKIDGNLHQRGQPHAGAHVIAEIEEGRSEGADAGERHAVHAGTHGVFANSEVQIASSIVAGLKVARAFEFERGFVRGGEVGRSSDEPRDILCKRVQHFAGTLACSHAFRISREAGDILVPSCGQFMMLHMAQALG